MVKIASNKEIDRILEQSQNKVKEMFKRVYAKQGMYGEMCNREEVNKQLLNYAQNKDTKTLIIKSIDLLVRSIGCHFCTIDVIQNLREQGICIFFSEDGMETYSTHFDMQLGAKITDASVDFQNELFSQIEASK